VHFHAVLLDGVYAATADGLPEFHELPPPEDREVLQAVTPFRGLAGRGDVTMTEPDLDSPFGLLVRVVDMAAFLPLWNGRALYGLNLTALWNSV
jgi:hypothetical protein